MSNTSAQDAEPISDQEPKHASEPSSEHVSESDSAPSVNHVSSDEQNEDLVAKANATEASHHITKLADPFTHSHAKRKKARKKILKTSIVAGMFIIVVLAVLILHFVTTSPTNLFKSAFIDLLNQRIIAFNTTSETSSGGQSTKYTVNVYSDNNGAAYARFTGIGALYKAYGTKTDDEFTEKSKELELNWWKFDADEKRNDNPFINGLANIDFKDYDKIASVYEKYPFLKVERSDGNYNTSGAVYKVTADEEKYYTFIEELEKSEVYSVPLGSLYLNEYTENLAFTITNTFFGNGVITGVYATDDSLGKNTSIDFEHAIKSAPTDAKDYPELEKLLLSMTGGNNPEDVGGEGSEVDIQRRKDYANLANAIKRYVINNDGKLPENGWLDEKKYINATGEDPTNIGYSLAVIDFEPYLTFEVTADEFATEVLVVKGAGCNNSTLVENSASHAFAVYGALENDNVYCLASN